MSTPWMSQAAAYGLTAAIVSGLSGRCAAATVPRGASMIAIGWSGSSGEVLAKRRRSRPPEHVRVPARLLPSRRRARDAPLSAPTTWSSSDRRERLSIQTRERDPQPAVRAPGRVEFLAPRSAVPPGRRPSRPCSCARNSHRRPRSRPTRPRRSAPSRRVGADRTVRSGKSACRRQADSPSTNQLTSSSPAGSPDQQKPHAPRR